MRFTKEQMETLSQYESYFTTAIRSKYARYPGLSGITAIHEILSSVSQQPRLNASCSSCVFRLLVECGRIYFEDKEEMAQMPKPKKTKKK